MQKYLKNKGFTESDIVLIQQLIDFYNTLMPYTSNVHRQLLINKVANDPEEFSRHLIKVLSSARKFNDELEKAVLAHGKKLFAR